MFLTHLTLKSICSFKKRLFIKNGSYPLFSKGFAILIHLFFIKSYAYATENGLITHDNALKTKQYVAMLASGKAGNLYHELNSHKDNMNLSKALSNQNSYRTTNNDTQETELKPHVQYWPTWATASLLTAGAILLSSPNVDSDKKLHFLVSNWIGATTEVALTHLYPIQSHTLHLATATLLATIPGYIKEKDYDEFSSKDMLYNALGGLSGALIANMVRDFYLTKKTKVIPFVKLESDSSSDESLSATLGVKIPI